MAYIGRDISNLSDRAVLDNITASATATYNLLLNSVAFVPSSAESLTVSLNGVIQKPQSSYTVSGSTIVFDSALTSSDSIDFIIAERSITLTGVGSGSVGTSQLVDGSVSNTKLANSSITLNGSAVSLGGSATIGGGKIGQVVMADDTTGFSTTGTSFVTGGNGLDITPTATSSKIYISVCFTGEVGGGRGYYTIYRDSTNVNGSNELVNNQVASVGNPISMHYLDSPSTTSQINYKIAIRQHTSGSVHVTAPCVFVAMEVLA